MKCVPCLPLISWSLPRRTSFESSALNRTAALLLLLLLSLLPDHYDATIDWIVLEGVHLLGKWLTSHILDIVSSFRIQTRYIGRATSRTAHMLTLDLVERISIEVGDGFILQIRDMNIWNHSHWLQVVGVFAPIYCLLWVEIYLLQSGRVRGILERGAVVFLMIGGAASICLSVLWLVVHLGQQFGSFGLRNVFGLEKERIDFVSHFLLQLVVLQLLRIVLLRCFNPVCVEVRSQLSVDFILQVSLIDWEHPLVAWMKLIYLWCDLESLVVLNSRDCLGLGFRRVTLK